MPTAALALVAWGLIRAHALPEEDLPSFAPAVPPRFEPLAAPGAEALFAGSVVDARGAPIAGATILLHAGDVSAWALSDSNGAFAVRGLPPGAARVTCFAWGFEPRALEVDLPQEGASLALGAPPPRPRPLPEILRAPLRGEVGRCLSAESWPSRYEVVFLPRDPPFAFGGPVLRAVRTDAEGRFELPDLAHGTYVIAVLPDWARGGSWPDLTAASSADYVHGAPSTAAPLTLVLACGGIEARLTDVEGRPVEGALALVRPAEQPARAWPPSTSGPDGRFEFQELPAGRYELELRAGEGALLEIPVEVEAGAVARPEIPPIRLRAR